MAIGIFGGTFDPVHTGHLRAAEEVRESFGLDKVFFVPGYLPPHKRNVRISDAQDRLKMVGLAIRENSFFKASDIEIRRGGISYTIDTIKRLEKRFDSLYFLIGADAFSEIDTWHDYRDLFYHTHFVVMVRPTHSRRSGVEMFPADIRNSLKILDASTFEHVSGRRIYLHKVTQLAISSTRIRASVQNNQSIRYLVPQPVERFISQRGLYRY
jgi:nicotinate-nucleotide adenylyltransferase